MSGKIGLIIIVIVALGLGVYLYSSGVAGGAFNSLGSLLSFPSSSSSSFFNFHLSTVQGPPPPSGGAPAGTIITSPSGNSAINAANIPAGYTASQLSPYFEQVDFGTVAGGNAYGSYGEITLNSNFYGSSTIDITGWQIKSVHGGEYIPQAINVYDPSGLTVPTDIRVKSGDLVYLFSSSAPFNLRLNECIGYIAHIATFVPALPLTCPYVDRSQIENFTGACQNYILSIGQCQAPDLSSIQIPRNDYACQDYLENNLNYKSCFNAHVGDANFLSNQIWVWTGSSNVVDQYHDTVLLFDKNGLLVDEYTY